MKTTPKSYPLYPNLGYWFLLIILLVFGGFYHTYFSVFFEPKATIIHVHFGLMAVWVIMLIVQPFLIKYKKKVLHRRVGKASYVLLPLLLISAFLMAKHGYFVYMDTIAKEAVKGIPKYTQEELLHLSAKYQALSMFYMFWLGLFYTLAIINRKSTYVHARYMLAAALTVLGPTVDRIWFMVVGISVFPLGIPVETLAYALIIIILIYLLWLDYKGGRNTKTLEICLVIYFISQGLYYVVQDMVWWEQFITFIMGAEPR